MKARIGQLRLLNKKIIEVPYRTMKDHIQNLFIFWADMSPSSPLTKELRVLRNILRVLL